MLVTDILARLRTDTSQFNSGMRGASRELSNFQHNAESAGTGIHTLMGIAQMAGVAASTAISAASTALIGLGVKGLQGTASMEQLKISMVGIFEGTGKSAQDAYNYLERLQKFAAATPFEFASLAETSKKLMAVGYEGDQVVDMLETMGNAAAAAGKGSDSVLRLANALQRAKGSGRLTGETIMMMSDAMPTFNARGAIAAELYGGDMTAAMKALETGTVDVDKAIGALMTGMQKLAGAEGAMERQSKTLIGIMSTFKDEVNMAMVRGLEPALPALEGALTKLIEPVSLFTKNFGQALGPALAKFINAAAPAIIELAQVLGPVLGQVITMLGPLLQGLLPILSVVIKAFGEFVSAIAQPLQFALANAMPMFKQFTDLLVGPFGTVLQAMAPLILPMAEALTSLLIAVMPLIPPFTELLIAVTPLITNFAIFAANAITLAQNAGLITPVLIGIVAAMTAMKVMAIINGLMAAGTALVANLTMAYLLNTGGINANVVATLAGASASRVQMLAFVMQKVALVGSTVATYAATAAQWALNAAMTANPIGVLIVGIAALVAAFVWLYNNVEGFRNFFVKAFDAIQSAVSSVVTWVRGNWGTLVALLFGPFGLAVKLIMDNWDKIIAFVQGIPAVFSNIANAIVQGLIDGFKNGGNAVMQAVKNLVMGPVDKIKELLGIHSPSKVTQDIGDNFGKGFEKGIKDKTKDVETAADIMGRRASTALGRHYTAMMAGMTVVGRYLRTMELDLSTGAGDAATRSYQAMAQIWTKGLGSKNADIIKQVKELFGIKDKAKVDAKADKAAGALGAGGAGAAKRLADIYVFGKLMGKNYGKGFADGYKTVRNVVEDATDQMRRTAQSIVDAANDMADKMREFASFTTAEAPSNAFLTAEGYIQNMRDRIEYIGKFSAALKKLKDLKLDSKVFADIAKAGPIAGMQMADALINGGQAAVDTINKLQTSLGDAAKGTADIYTQGTTGNTLAYAQAQAGMTVNFGKDAINVNVGAGASAADAAEIRKIVVKAIREAMALATKAEKAG